MAKSEIPSIVVQSGGGSTNNHNDMEQQQQQQQHHQYASSRPSRLEKQEEFEVEEDVVYMPSPVTIQIEDRGSGPEDVGGVGEVECGMNGSKLEVGDGRGNGDKDDSGDTATGRGSEGDETKGDRGKVPSQRVKLLVRSQAVHDDASPPPDFETVITNTNMLSVTNAPAFATQTQSKSSNKNRLGRQGSSQGSQGSTESSSGLSRDSSTETYTDSTGVDLQQFIIDTLHKNQKDRITMFKIEQELIALVKDNKRHSQKFGQMSSYNRMLVHRVAAFFGLDHYVDSSGTAVIVNKTKNTRIPDSRFQDYCRDELFPEEPKKSILKRDSISFEEKEKSPERQSSTDSRRSKSFEEREEEYEKARARIFNQDDPGLGESPASRRSSQEDIRWPSSDTRPWSSTDSDSSGRPLGAKVGSSFETEPSSVKPERPIAVLTKAESENKELLIPNRSVRPVMTKASSFGGISVLSREISGGKHHTPKITKAESFNVTTLSGSHSMSGSLCESIQSQATASSSATSTPPSLVSSSVEMQPTCPSQSSTATTQQTFPVVAGQPTQTHVPIQQFSSQYSGWPVGNREAGISTEYASQPVVGQQPLVWPVSTAPELLFPSGIVISPQAGVPCMNLENLVYRYKLPSSAGGQTLMLTPFQQLAVPPHSQVPISSHMQVGSAMSPPNQQQQQQQAQQHHGPPSTLQLPLSSQQPQQQQPHPPPPAPPPPPASMQQQQQQHQSAQMPQSQPHTIVYVPYIPSQIQQPFLAHPGAAQAAGIQNVQQQQQQQPPPPQQQQQMQPQPSQQPQMLSDQRAYALNTGSSSSVDEITSQLPAMSLLPSHISLAQPQEAQTPTGRNIISVDPSSSPQGFVIPAFKSQGYITPQAPFPVYYVHQVQQPSNVHPVRFAFPASPSIPQQPAPVGHGQNMGISGQMVSDMQSHVTQAGPQITGPQYLPGYPILALSQTGETTATSTYVTYTLASHTAATTTTTSVLVPSSPVSMPVYPYGNMVIGSLSSVTQASFASPTTTQSAHQTPTYVQTPIAVQAPAAAAAAAVPMYVIATTTSAQAPIAQAQMGSNCSATFTSYRSQSLPSAPSGGSSGNLGAPLSSNSAAMGYAVYSAPHFAAAAVAPHTTATAVAQVSHATQAPAAPVTPTILTTFQVLRPGMPLVGSVRTGTPPPPTPAQNIVAQYATQPSSANKVPFSFPLVKQASDPGVECFGLGNGRAEQSKCGRTAQMQSMALSACRPASGLVCPRSVPVMQDVCLIGAPLQHHFSPVMLPQQRSIARMMHPSGSNTLPSTRPPKNRSKRTKGSQLAVCVTAAGGAARNGALFQPVQDISASHILEIEGLPDGMKRSEIERYLEQVSCHGAKIQFVDAESGLLLSSDTDFVVSARHLVVAVFESDTAAQSALLGIKTPKFQLRPLRQSARDVSLKKFS